MFALLTTKLMPPAKRAALVQRSDLTGRVRAGAAQRLVVVSAPAGYGKTSILAAVHAQLREEGRAVAWLSLEDEDNDLARFLLYVVEAARRAGLPLGLGTKALIESGTSVSPEVLRSAFINELALVEEEFFLFLDDYHLVTEPAVAQTLTAILLSPLARVHLLVATRSPTSLPISRLRALGDVHEVEATDLAFSAQEITDFFALNGRTLDVASATTVRDRTEGWAASLQMLAIAARAAPDLGEVLGAFSGEHRSVGDFLAEEVLKRQPPDLQTFLLATSILRRFNSDLCNAVMQRADARETLDRVEGANLFIFSLDQEHHWYRYHHLFSDFLRRRLAERHPATASDYYRRACEWFVAHGYMTDAVEIAFAADDLPRAGELLDAASGQLFATGQTAMLHAYAARLPSDILQTLCQLQFELAWDYQIQWRFDDSRAALNHVRCAMRRQARRGTTLSRDELARIETTLAHRDMTLAVFTDDYTAALAQCRRWQSEGQSGDPFMNASAGTVLMLCNRERYRCDDTEAAATAWRGRFLEKSGFYGTVFHDVVTGGTLAMRGQLAEAICIYRRARESAVSLHGELSPLAAMPSMLLAEALYERNAVDEAQGLLDTYRDVSAEFGFLDNAIARYLTESRLARYRGDPREAARALAAGMQVASHHGFARLEVQLFAEQVRQLIADGHPGEALQLAEDRRHRDWFALLMPDQDADTTREALAVTRARLCCERGRPGDAVPLMRRWFSFVRDRHCLRSAVRLGTVLARLHDRRGDAMAARRVMLDVLQCGAPGHLIRSLVDEGGSARLLLEDALTASAEAGLVALDYGRALSAALGANADSEGDRLPHIEGVPAPPLTKREIEVLRLSADNLASAEVARALGLSEGTVKWYWRQIFLKLSVHRRSQALRLARRRGYI